jgi:hypothetical protein
MSGLVRLCLLCRLCSFTHAPVWSHRVYLDLVLLHTSPLLCQQHLRWCFHGSVAFAHSIRLCLGVAGLCAVNVTIMFSTMMRNLRLGCCVSVSVCFAFVGALNATVCTASRRGSVSAEHGLGQAKSKYLSMSVTPAAMDSMKQVCAYRYSVAGAHHR